MKKVLALVLAVVLAFGMASVAFAADLSYTYKVGGTTSTLGISDSNFNWPAYQGLQVQPNQELKLNLWVSPYEFGLASDIASSVYEPMTVSNLTSSKYDITAKKTKGYPALDTVKLVNKKIAVPVLDADGNYTYTASGARITENVNHVFIEVKFIKEMVTTSDQDFEYDIAFTYKKSKIEESVFTIYGNMENPIIEVDEDDDTIDLKDGSVAEALDFVKDIEIDAGNGVYVTLNMFENCKYYCKAVIELSTTDAEILDKTTAIEGVITMKTATSKNATFRSAKVNMELGDKYYVYDADGKYIGVSTDTLPFSSKYYLATSKIDMGSTATEVPGTEPTTPVDPANPTTGGDTTPVNANDNPGTGANGFVNVAVVAGMVALAAAGAVSLKK